MDNGIIKVGVNLDWGGAISEIIYQGKDLVNRNDDGRLVQVALNDGNQTYNYSDFGWAGWGYEPTQAGDKYGHYSSVLTYTIGENSIYTKTHPLEWNPDNKGGGNTQGIRSDVYVEQWISLDGQSVKVDYKVTHFGSDNHAVASQGIPGIYVNSGFDRLITYDGNSPWNGDSPFEKQVPPYPGGGLHFRPTEYWASFVNNSDFGLTVYATPHSPHWYAELFPSNETNAFGPVVQSDIPPGTIIETTTYVIAGDYVDARSKIYSLHNNEIPITAWEFNQDGSRGNWLPWHELTPFVFSGGNLKTSSTGMDPQMGQWSALGIDATTYKTIEIRMKIESGVLGTIYFTTLVDDIWHENKAKTFYVNPGDNFVTYVLDMSTVSTWTGTISQIRLDPTNASGKIEIDYIRILPTVVNPEEGTIAVAKAGSGGGKVTSSPGGIDCGADCAETYPSGTSVTLTATPDNGSIFAGWRDVCSGIGPCTPAVDGDKTATAIFVTPLAVGASALDGEVGVPYHGTLGISGGLAPYNVSIVKGALPAGLSPNSEGIVGTPTKAGISSFMMQVTDALGSSVSKKFRMKVFQALSISTKSLKKGKVGRKYSTILMATGGKKPYAWSLVSGDLPKGLSLESSTGKITGIPAASGSFNLTFQMTDALDGVVSKSFLLNIN